MEKKQNAPSRLMNAGFSWLLEPLVEAFVELEADPGNGQFGVSLLVERAGVNRATFYRYFENLEDFRGRGFVMFLDAIASDFPVEAPQAGSEWRESAIARFERLIRLVRSHAAFFRMIMTGAGGMGIFKQAEEFLTSFFLNDRILPASDDYRLPGQLAARCVVSLVREFALWSLNRPEDSERTIAKLFIEVVEGGIYGGPN